MLIKIGFVSNSSSTSFVIDKSDLSKLDTQKLEILFLDAEDSSLDNYNSETWLNKTSRHFYGNLSYHSREIIDFFVELRKRGIEIDEEE